MSIKRSCLEFRHVRLIVTNGLGLLSLSIAITSAFAQAPSSEGMDIAYRKALVQANGNADRGRRLVEDTARTRCLLCHSIEGRGGKTGPDLMGVGGRLSFDELIDSVLEPSAKLHPDYIATTVSTKDGRVIQGIVRPVAEDEVEVATSDTQTVRLKLDDIEERKPSKVSAMPAGLHYKLVPSELADILTYLRDLRPAKLGVKNEAIDLRDIPKAVVPVTFQPVISRDQAFQRPVWFCALPGQPGVNAVVEIDRARIWLLHPESVSPRRSLFVDLGKETTPGELTGLTSVAFHPDYLHNRRYFIKIHTPKSAGRLAVQVIERKGSDDGLTDSGTVSKRLLNIPVFSEIHNGGHLAFGNDGNLYVGMGDTGPQGDPRGHAQDLSRYLGKMLRIDVDKTEGDLPYSIPPDNPFRKRAGALPEIWALGFREPWRFSFDAKTGDLWVGDVGQGQYEEVGITRIGENHGWNILEGLRRHSERFASKDADYVPPVFAYSHRIGPSVTGGFVYRGTKHPSLQGKYLFGDFETRRVWALEFKGRQFVSILEIGRAPDRISSFGVDDRGEIHLVGLDQGLIHRIDSAGADLQAATASKEVVPTSRDSGIRWKITRERPSTTWIDPDFDDSEWMSAEGGFGTQGTPNAVVRTDWRSPDIWLRRKFDLPGGPSKMLNLSVHHDEDAEVYINGILAARLRGFGRDYEDVPISPEALATLEEKENSLAVHCHQVNGGQYIDVGIVERQAKRP